MKLKHLILAGMLTTVAAVMLLTLVVPQTAEAGPPSFICYTVEGCGVLNYQPTTRKIARQLCKDTPFVTYCETQETHRFVCEGSGVPCP